MLVSYTVIVGIFLEIPKFIFGQ